MKECARRGDRSQCHILIHPKWPLNQASNKEYIMSQNTAEGLTNEPRHEKTGFMHIENKDAQMLTSTFVSLNGNS